MSAKSSPKRTVRRSRSIYLLPNLFTISALFAGFYAIVAAMKGHFNTAALSIFIAMVLDSLDGRIARLTNTQSAFGAQLDSLSDMVSFGVAPALVVYTWSLSSLGKIGWLSSFLFAVATALRLARFNTASADASASDAKRYFRGLACPAGAACIASLVWMADEWGIAGPSINLLVAFITVLLAMLMVSNVRYRSFKDFDLKGRVPFMVILGIVLVYVLISLDPPQVLFVIFFGYALYGPVWDAYKRFRGRKTGV